MDELDFITPAPHIKEQAVWRLTEINKKSPECTKQGSCISCGCDLSGKVWEDRACDENCYPIMMTEKEWETFKKINNIKVEI